MKGFLKNRAGFTLIELLVVIAIIGVLAAVVLLAINPTKMLKQGRDSQRESDLTNLRKTIDVYIASSANPTILPGGNGVTRRSDTANYCTENSGTRTSANTGGWLIPCGALCSACGSPSPQVDLSKWIAKIPTDPKMSTLNLDSDPYHYLYQTTASVRYCLSAKYEQKTGYFRTGTFESNTTW